MRLPSQVQTNLLIDHKPIQEAIPDKLWRKKNQAATLDFSVPRETYLSKKDIEYEFRQGSIVELYLGEGSAGQRIFYGYLPPVTSDRDLSESHALVKLSALDFIGQLTDYSITLGDATTSSFLDPRGYEIGAFVSTLITQVINSQYLSNAFTAQGIQGTNPTAQFIDDTNVQYGTGTVKKHIDYYTSLAFDDSNYPSPPLLYSYHQRDTDFWWVKETDLATGKPSMILTIGQDAIVSGKISRMPLYSDTIANTKTKLQWSHSDTDTKRRWGGRVFGTSLTSKSSFIDVAQADAVRNVELFKNERRAYTIDTFRDPFLLYPGDLLAIYNSEAYGLPSGNQRVSEVQIQFHPVLRSTITVGDTQKLLTDFLIGSTISA